MAEYPEHEKLSKISDKSQAVGDFLEWLRGEKEIVFAAYEPARWFCPHCGEIPEERVHKARNLMVDDHGCRECIGSSDADRWKSVVTFQSGGLYPRTLPPMEKLLAEFFDIDLDVIEDEKRHMMDAMREANAPNQ